MIQMNVNFEEIEKAWGKPKKTVLDELEEYFKGYDIEYLHQIMEHNLADVIETLLDKIQELKKENKNGRIF